MSFSFINSIAFQDKQEDSYFAVCKAFILPYYCFTFKLHCLMTGFDALHEPLGVEEMLLLESFLISERFSGNAMSIDALDGFFTALVIGPATLLPSEWMPFVLGTEMGGVFSSVEEAQKIMQLLLRYMNSIAAAFQEDADEFVPIFECCDFETPEDERAAATSWALGFILGMEIRFDEWKPIFDVAEDDNEDEELILAPILLLAGQENEAHELTSKDRDLLKELVGESVMNIFRFWLPYREQALNQLRNNPDKPKIIPFDIDASLSGPDIQ